jgi:PAS domain S-box-containing protein
VHKNGQLIDVAVRLSPITDAAGKVIGFAGIGRDITERKRAEVALQESEERFRATFEQAAVGMALEGMDSRYLLVNERLCDIVGYSANELLGMKWEDVTHPDDLASKLATDEFLAQGVGHYSTFQRRYVHKDGSTVWVKLTVTLVRHPSGEPKYFITVIEDITELRRAGEERAQLAAREQEARARTLAAEEASRLKSEFLANMSHELRTPLYAIIGFSELVYDEIAAPLAPENKDFLSQVLSASNHLLQLINDILDLAKVEAGKMDFLPEPIDLGQACAEVIEGLRPLSGGKDIALQLSIDSAVRQVEMDGLRLRQVLYNYLSNAVKFTAKGGQVILRAQPASDGMIRIEVEDTGSGIAPNDLPKLFTSFQQLESGMGKRHQGTGLGLALTKQIVEAQGGRVGATSVLGQGSIFFAELPRLVPSLQIRADLENKAEPHAAKGR